MKRLFIPVFIGALVSQWGGLAKALPWGWSPKDRAIDRYWRAQIKKASGDCAQKLGIKNLPDNTIDLVARYDWEKSNAFNDCVRAELGIGAWE
jgi:hypothetical protein